MAEHTEERPSTARRISADTEGVGDPLYLRPRAYPRGNHWRAEGRRGPRASEAPRSCARGAEMVSAAGTSADPGGLGAAGCDSTRASARLWRPLAPGARCRGVQAANPGAVRLRVHTPRVPCPRRRGATGRDP